METNDTPSQKRMLRQSKVARKVRAQFPAGTRVRSFTGHQGTVKRHVPGLNAVGGTLVVDWDSGTTGRHSASQVEPVSSFEPADDGFDYGPDPILAAIRSGGLDVDSAGELEQIRQDFA